MLVNVETCWVKGVKLLKHINITIIPILLSNHFCYCFVDLDECNSPIGHACDPNALCTNTEGSYVCRCIRGFKGDGRNCTGKFNFCYKIRHLRNERETGAKMCPTIGFGIVTAMNIVFFFFKYPTFTL